MLSCIMLNALLWFSILNQSTDVCSFWGQVVCSPRRGSVCPQGPETGCDNWVLVTVCTGTVSPTGAQQDGGVGAYGEEKRRKWGAQSLKLMSLVCAGRRQLLSEFTVCCRGGQLRHPVPPPFLPKHAFVFDVYLRCLCYCPSLPL